MRLGWFMARQSRRSVNMLERFASQIHNKNKDGDNNEPNDPVTNQEPSSGHAAAR